MAERIRTRAEFAGDGDGDRGYEEPPERKRKAQTPLRRKSRMKRGQPKKRRMNVAGMVTATEWAELRKLVFARSGHRCERCGTPRRQCRLDPHHRKLTAHGGPDAAFNLAALCVDCHAWAHRNPVEATLQGWIVPSWADPARRAITLYTGQMVLLGDDGTYTWVGRL